MTSLIDHTYLISARMRNFSFDEMTKFSKGASDKKWQPGWEMDHVRSNMESSQFDYSKTHDFTEIRNRKKVY